MFNPWRNDFHGWYGCNYSAYHRYLVDHTQRLAEEIFTSETKYMITEVTSYLFEGELVYFLKPAPEIVLGICDIPISQKDQLLAANDQR